MSKDALSRLGDHFRRGPVAMVATRWGSDEAARKVVQRAGAVAEAMDRTAVVLVADRLGLRALELRSITNPTAIVSNKSGDWTTLWLRWGRPFVRWSGCCAANDLCPAGNQHTVRCILLVEFHECYRSVGSDLGKWEESCVMGLSPKGLEPQRL